jgi:hypothetical protein
MAGLRVQGDSGVAADDLVLFQAQLMPSTVEAEALRAYAASGGSAAALTEVSGRFGRRGRIAQSAQSPYPPPPPSHPPDPHSSFW